MVQFFVIQRLNATEFVFSGLHKYKKETMEE